MKTKQRWLIASLATLIAGFTMVSCHRAEPRDEYRIALTYIGPHELINQIVTGFRTEMGTQFNGKPVVIIERHANGDPTKVSSMLNGVLAERPNVLATITTVVSQQALKSTNQVPIVFVGVTDPVGAGLANTLEHPGKATGVSDVPPLDKTLAIAHAMFPAAKRLGFVYSPNEQPAVYSRQQVELLAPKYGFTVDARAITSQDALPIVVRDMVRRNDVMMVGADNGMFAAAPVLAKIAIDAHKPFFAADSTSVKDGMIAGVTVNYVDVGVAGAKVVKNVLKGANVADMSVVSLTDGMLEVNASTLKKLNVALPPDIAAQVRHTYP